MIVVILEIWPKGDKLRRRTLAVGTIHNDDTGTVDVGNYVVRLLKSGKEFEVWKSGAVEGFPRKSHLGVWDLLYRALRNVVGSRNKESG